MAEPESVDASKAKLFGTIRFVLIVGALIAGVYFLWPIVKKEIKEQTEQQEADAELAAIPRQIEKFDLKIDPGFRSHDLIFTNTSDYVLTNVTVDVKMIKDDRTTTDAKGHWDKWSPGQPQKVNVSAEGARWSGFSVVLVGKATVTSKKGTTKEVVISGAWMPKE